ncbi:hypothetical protein [Streptomyces sp. NPDC054797]
MEGVVALGPVADGFGVDPQAQAVAFAVPAVGGEVAAAARGGGAADDDVMPCASGVTETVRRRSPSSPRSFQ